MPNTKTTSFCFFFFTPTKTKRCRLQLIVKYTPRHRFLRQINSAKSLPCRRDSPPSFTLLSAAVTEDKRSPRLQLSDSNIKTPPTSPSFTLLSLISHPLLRRETFPPSEVSNPHPLLASRRHDSRLPTCSTTLRQIDDLLLGPTADTITARLLHLWGHRDSLEKNGIVMLLLDQKDSIIDSIIKAVLPGTIAPDLDETCTTRHCCNLKTR
ncbi:unnamed protein product [Microthlaspi erraticum]|uniref:Uncharacterized protein n=1 Tax=Microthlaspi erraticum TaxID=1685480 RepID=A0A6D2IUY9_9BRAS|nr:unnamed protein product [Microthlaspi erraticum]